MRYTILFLCCLAATALCAQQDRLELTPKSEGMNIKPELRFGATVSFPLGSYAQIDSVSSRNGAAKIGGGIDVVFTHRIRRAPLWGIHVAAGYLQHGFKSQIIEDTFGMASFTAKPWNVIYLMPGFGFQGGKRFKFEINAHVGFTFFNGWNASRADYIDAKNDFYRTRDWQYAWRAALGVRGGILLGYKVSDRALIFAEGWVQPAWGSRIGTLTQKDYDLDSEGFPLDEPMTSENFRVLQPTFLFTVNISAGVKVILYRYLVRPELPSDK